MANYRICDAHTHIFPQSIALKASVNIGEFYHIPMFADGLASSLLREGAKIGVSRYLVCSAATTPKQVSSINDFIAASCREHPEFVGLGTLHPHMEDPDAEISRICEFGFPGVKLHPDFQLFYADDPAMRPIYARLEREGLLVLFHAGDDRYDYSAPARIARVAAQFPRLRCLASHFGGYSRWSESGCYRGLSNIWFDTSSSLFRLPPSEAVAMIRSFGADRFLFGTDFPMWSHEKELQRFLALDLTEAEREQILSGTFSSLFPA